MLVTEEEIRRWLAQLSIRMRRTQRDLAVLNQRWLELVAERIELVDRLATFEIDRTERL